MTFPWEKVLLVVGQLALFAVFISCAIYFSRRSSKKLKERYDLLQQKYGGEVTFRQTLGMYRDLLLTTQISGRVVKFGTYTRGSGKNSTSYIYVAVALPGSEGKTLSLGTEGIFSKIGKALGGQDVQTHDPNFDDKFVIKSNDETYARNILNSSVRAEFTQLYSVSRGFVQEYFSVNDGFVRYDIVGSMRRDKDRDFCEAMLPNLIRIVEVSGAR